MEMTDIEQLEEKKRRLLLEREIASLERSRNLEHRIVGWAWWWVAPLSIFGALLFGMGSFEVPFGSDNVAFLVLSVFALIPISLKLKIRLRQ